MAERTYLAIDLGAESGRALLGRLDGGRVTLEEVHRFPNVPVWVGDGLYWDAPRIFAEVKRGISEAGQRTELASLAVDSWGVDYGLLDRDGELLSNPRNYRDPRTDGMMEEAFGRVSREEIYARTGIQFMQINTLYQLLATRGSPLLEAAETLLLMPDLMNYWLTGEKTGEFTNATTTQLYDITTGDWARDLAGALGIPGRVFPPITQPATPLGPLLGGIVEEAGLPNRPAVVTAASHDTASAVAAVPAEGEGFAYISSGTWSLAGVETPEPVVTPEALAANFTNEGGFGGRTRFLKNVMGLWLLQECRKQWAREGREHSYDELEKMAGEVEPFGPVVDPDHLSFFAPGDMPGRIEEFCGETGQRAPGGPAEIARCVFESLALKYRLVIEQAGELAGKSIGGVHVVGGGSQNSLLCQLTADATGLPVLAGPVEATAVGNVMVQALADGEVGSLEEIRAVVRASVEPKVYEPRGEEASWREAAGRLRSMMESVSRVGEKGAEG